MVVRKVRIMDSAVDSDKIAADTIVPADIDETVAYNFSSTSGTFGRLRADQQMAEVVVNAVAGANNFSFPFTFAGAPTCTVTKVTSSTANLCCSG